VISCPLRHPSESWDLGRQALHHEALGPSFRWGDGNLANGGRFPDGRNFSEATQSRPTAFGIPTHARSSPQVGGELNVLYDCAPATAIIGKPHHSYRDKPFSHGGDLP